MHRCKDCGYLSAWRTDLLQFDSAPSRFRETGRMPMNQQGHPIYALNPTCSMNMPLGGIANQSLSDDSTDGDRKAIIDRAHDCAKFSTLQTGLSPKEHLEMDMLREQLKEQRAWQVVESDNAKKRHDEGMAAMQASARLNARYLLMSAVISAISVLLAVVIAKWIG